MKQQTPIMITLSPRIINPFKYALYMLVGFVTFDLFASGAITLGISQNTIASFLCAAILIGNMGIASKVCNALFDGPTQARINLLGTICDLYFGFYIFIHIIRIFHQMQTLYHEQIEILAYYV